MARWVRDIEMAEEKPLDIICIVDSPNISKKDIPRVNDLLNVLSYGGAKIVAVSASSFDIDSRIVFDYSHMDGDKQFYFLDAVMEATRGSGGCYVIPITTSVAQAELLRRKEYTCLVLL